MTQPTPQADGLRWAVLGDERADAALRSHPALSNASSVTWFRPRDADDLAEAVRTGAIDGVLVRRLDVLLGCVLDEVVDLAAWRQRGIRIRIADQDGLVTIEPVLAALSAAAAQWHASRRRRRAVAGGVLSVIAIISAAAATLLPLWLRWDR